MVGSRKVRDYKSYEVYSELRLPPGVPLFVRCDGRNFRRLSEELNLEKPYDEEFAKSMVRAARAIYEGDFNPALVYVFSDEVNVLLLKSVPFEARLEKLISIIPSLISSALARELLEKWEYRGTLSFDARAVLLPGEEILGYLIWRQSEAWRNCVNSYAFHALVSKGLSARRAAEVLEGMKYGERHELVYRELGVNLNEVPTWQRRGVLLYREEYEKHAVDRATGREVRVKRRRVVEEWNPPLFSTEEGARLIARILEYERGGV